MAEMSKEAIDSGFECLGNWVVQLQKNWDKAEKVCNTPKLKRWLASKSHLLKIWIITAENNIKEFSRTENNVQNLRKDIIIVNKKFDDLAACDEFAGVVFEKINEADFDAACAKD